MNQLKLFVCLSFSILVQGVFADTILVPDDYLSIQAGVNAAQEGDLVLVSDGVYYESVNFSGKNITIQSVNGSGSTKIDGNSSSGSVITVTSGESDAVLDGFIVRNGDASNGAGIYIANSTISVLNCEITNNNSSSNGGGIFVDTGVLSLTDVNIHDNISNSTGGGIYMRYSSGTIVGGAISSNTGTNGGGVYLKDSAGQFVMDDVLMEDNNVSGNGGGLYVRNTIILIDDSEILSNSANRGGGVYTWSDGDGTILNTTFEGNTAEDVGGAANIRNSSVDFRWCVFNSNIADRDCDGNGSGAAIDSGTNSNVRVEEPTICGNLLCDVEDDFSGAVKIIGEIEGCDIGLGACCGGNACWEMEQADCLDGGGEFQGGGTVCEIIECVGFEDVGGCCVGSICVQTSNQSCEDSGGAFEGVGIDCSVVVCSIPCQADFDGNGSVDVDDLVHLIGLWGACP